ncbi:MAG: hypothetical protein GX764_06780 [Firmicutes bacterium]|nr:hypothetical protein [Bacillota bacterium]
MKLSSFFVGLFFILAGLLLLLNNFGYNTTFLVGQLFKLWPLLLILIGASIYWGGKLPRWLAFILIIMLVGGIIVLTMTHSSPRLWPFIIKKDILIV